MRRAIPRLVVGLIAAGGGCRSSSLPAPIDLAAGDLAEPSAVDGAIDGAPPPAADAAAGCDMTAAADMGHAAKGAARIQLLSPTLVRVEYADDGRFEDRPSFNVLERAPIGAVAHEETVEGGWRVLRTASMEVRYKEGSGPFTADNLTVSFRQSGNEVTVHPWGKSSDGNLKGWYRALDGEKGPVALHDGLLSRQGWYLLDDSATALWDGEGAMPAARPPGRYQSGYLFVYGHDYKHALSELAALTGRAPLPPRWAFGNWYSRYYAYKDQDYRDVLLPKFRSERVPLDVLVVDTDWKQPSDFIGWSWNAKLFPNPDDFLKWARDNRLYVTLNIHPAIDAGDPRFAALDAQAGGLTSIGGTKYIWDWGQPQQIASYLAAHRPFSDEGVRFWWLDWCCDAGKVSLPGVTPDTWVNQLYAKEARQRGQRPLLFSRIGAYYDGYARNDRVGASGPWAEHRYAIHFTGDTAATWELLAFESAFTVAEGNIGLPYVTHDIGSFYGAHLAEEMYVRWVQLGTFQPILRLHSNHGDRLPWDYSEPAKLAAEKFLRLRAALVPYLYTLARQAYDTGLPLARGLYYDYPESDAAYTAAGEYLLGDRLLVAPVAAPGNPATRSVWLPEGMWYGYFDDKLYSPGSVEVTAALDVMPLFVRGGSILPMEPYQEQVGVGPAAALILKVYPGADGAFTLYEDAGDGLGYEKGELARTTFRYLEPCGAEPAVLEIGAAVGRFPTQAATRDYEIEFHAAAQPRGVRVDHHGLAAGAPDGINEAWWFAGGVVHVRLKSRLTSQVTRVVVAEAGVNRRAGAYHRHCTNRGGRWPS